MESKATIRRIDRPAAATLASLLVVGVLGLSACGPSSEENSPDAGMEEDGSVRPDYEVPFRAGTDHLQVREGDSFEPIFVKGINLGVGVPGTLAGQLAASRDQYERWLNRMRQIGFNAVRIYTLHDPRFYEVLLEHNRNHPDDPLYLLQGVWLGVDDSSADLFERSEAFDDNIREIVDCIHGACSIESRYGEAFGDFEADVSRWTLGLILGREFTPSEVQETNAARDDLESFDGEMFGVEQGDPIEVWFAERLEEAAAYEKSTYGVERPLSIASWPTLDPLDHPTESPRYSSEDVADFDLSKIRERASRGGLFASYHAYPYYPNFMSEDPEYREYEDEYGPNGYLGYLHDLNDHYDEMPLLIAEFGVPTSWVNAHSGYEGMNHGGHTEREQGRAAIRMFENQLAAETAGGALFAWLDEWWKPTWITNPRDFPFKRRRLWHNVTAPEQNFGLVAFDIEEPAFDDAAAATGSGPVARATVVPDSKFFRVRLELERRLTEDDRIVVGFDTYADDLGESVLPGGVEAAENRLEFALVLEGRSRAELSVMEDYQLAGIWYDGMEGGPYRSVQSDGGAWKLVRFQQSQPHGTPDGEFWFESTFDDAGLLGVREGMEEATNQDAVVHTERAVRIRVPWTYLAVTDPSRRRVMHDDPSTEERETRETEGIALSVAADGELLFETGRFSWEPWEEAPETTEREKRSVPVVSEGLETLPDRLDGE